jgi:hypothetical protein
MREGLDVIPVDLGEFGDSLRIPLVVRRRVERLGDARLEYVLG